jgi:hypothetical protein
MTWTEWGRVETRIRVCWIDSGTSGGGDEEDVVGCHGEVACALEGHVEVRMHHVLSVDDYRHNHIG